MAGSLLCSVVEDLLGSLGGELRCECRRLLAAPLAVVAPPHRVGPAVAVGNLQPDPALGQHLLERGTVEAARVGQCLVHVVAEGLLESAGGELLTAQLPVGLRSDRVRVGLQPVLDEDLVVDLTQPVRPRRVALERLAGQLVVVDDDDVRVDVLTVRVNVHDHHVLGAVRSPRELTRDVDGTGDVLRLGDVELLRVEREDEVVDLVLAPVCLRLSLGVLDELLRGAHRAGVPRGSRRAVGDMLTVLLATSVQHVRHRAANTQPARDLHVRAHSRVPSPRSARNPSITAHASSSRASSTTTLIDSPSLRARAMSRRKPSKVAPILRSVSTFAPSI